MKSSNSDTNKQRFDDIKSRETRENNLENEENGIWEFEDLRVLKYKYRETDGEVICAVTDKEYHRE